MSSELLDDFEYGFVDEHLLDRVEDKIVKELLICPLFPHILRSPIKCAICETHFCSKCLERSLEINGKCPICRSEISLDQKESEPSKILLFLLDNLKISCENSSKGCNEKFFYHNKEGYEEHLAEKCFYVDVSCPNYKCGRKCLKKNLDSHMKECGLEELNCDYCNQKFARNLMEDHIKMKICSDVCKWCSKRFQYENEQNHYQECEYMLVVCLRCQKILSKKDFQKHKDFACCSKSTILMSSKMEMGKKLENSYFIRKGVNEEQMAFSYQNQQSNEFNGANSATYLKIHHPFCNSGNNMMVMKNFNMPNMNSYIFYKRS